MDSNSTSNGTGSNDDVTVKLTYAALGISIAAFVLSTLQALLAYLQFDNSEVGRRRCSEELMGEFWARKTKRKYKWAEWRYQIWFEVPVFYTAKPSITVGPLVRKKPRNRNRDWVMEKFTRSGAQAAKKDKKPIPAFQDAAIPLEKIEIQPNVETIYKITGTETSCNLTMARYVDPEDKEYSKWKNVHAADDEGCSWVLLLDALQNQEAESRAWDNAPQKGHEHTLCVLMQRKPRCWDFMPQNITKPYATTTICHLVEMSSMLGCVWQAFDMKTPSLKAEGNGFLIVCEYVAGLGLMAKVARLGKSEHKKNRMIPCEELKRLCFGEVPSLFDATEHKLQVGPGLIDHTLKRLLHSLEKKDREGIIKSDDTAHRFPIIFELVAMVAKSVHIPTSRFRRLPNPCGQTWNPCLDIILCLKEFTDIIMKESINFGDHEFTKQLKSLIQHGTMDSLILSDQQTLSQKIQRYIAARTDLTAPIPENYGTAEQISILKDQRIETHQKFYIDLLDQLHLCIKSIDERLQPLFTAGTMVEEIITLHLKAMLKYDSTLSDTMSKHKKEIDMINWHVNNIYPLAAQEVTKSASSSNLLLSSNSGPNILEKSTTSNSGTGSDESTLGPEKDIPGERSAIWLALMLRMWAWLFLHDFNPEDKMIERTELMENRLPVYIG